MEKIRPVEKDYCTDEHVVDIGSFGLPEFDVNPYFFTYGLNIGGIKGEFSTKPSFWNNLFLDKQSDPYCPDCFKFWSNPINYLSNKTRLFKTSVYQVISPVWEELVKKLGELPVLLKNAGKYHSGITILDDGIPRIVSPMIIGVSQIGRPIFNHRKFWREQDSEFDQGVLVGNLTPNLNFMAYRLLKRRLSD